MTTHRIWRGSFVIGLAVALGLATASVASAHTYYYPPAAAPAYQNSQLRQQLIAQIYALLAQLQAQVPGGSFYDVEVESLPATDVRDDEAKLWGEVDLNDAPYAIVWFEYGLKSPFLSQVSRSGRIDRQTSERFRGDLQNLVEDQRYYFRAVAQDPAGFRTYGETRSFVSDQDFNDDDFDDFDDDEPDAITDRASDVRDTSAVLRGEVDMNDFEDGLVFFAYGEDEDAIEDVEDEDQFDDIDEQGDDLQLIEVDRNLDDQEDYEERVGGLDEDTDYFFRICVEFEDDDGDQAITCGDVEAFDTDSDDDDDNFGDEPDVTTNSATDITDDSAVLRGEVDMNDFEDGLVFFAYGEDEDEVIDIEDEDEFDDLDEDDEDLQLIRVDSDLDDQTEYELNISGLDEDTDYFFRICVEFEDDDGDQAITCGDVEDFTTDN